MTIILFIIGFYILLKGADILVEGSASIAQKFNIPQLVIGLTVVSFGTSAPELIINILASFNGNADLAIGNIFGSNIANILLILGVTAIFREIPVKQSTVLSEIPFTLVATFLVGFLANATLFKSEPNFHLSRYDGIILIFFFAIFLVYILKLSKDEKFLLDEIPNPVPIKKSVVYVIIGIISLFFGGKWVVEGALYFSEIFGLSESFIGLTIVSIGTSLPELATTVVAARKGNNDIAVGNIVGSNIFNLLWVLGLSAFIKDLPFSTVNNQDLMMIVTASAILIISISIGKKFVIQRSYSIFYLIIYFIYLVFIYFRDSV